MHNEQLCSLSFAIIIKEQIYTHIQEFTLTRTVLFNHTKTYSVYGTKNKNTKTIMKERPGEGKPERERDNVYVGI